MKKKGKKKNKAWIIYLVLIVAVILPYFGMFWIKGWYEKKLSDVTRVSFLLINKENLTLTAYDSSGDVVVTFPVACGAAWGNKVEKGDNRTPEGIFRITEIQNASSWKHDFGDGEGEISGAYGPWFIRLYTDPHKGIGIHGTHLPNSIGTRCTEGCIRLRNEDVAQLKELSYPGLNVIITPSSQDAIANKETAKF